MIDQLSVYIEKKGAVLKVLSLLAQSDINVLGLVSKDNTEFGTLRLILSNTQLAKEKLEEAGYVCRTCKVIGVELDDAPGAMERMLACVEFMNVSIDYLYVGYARESSMPIIIIRCEFAETVESNLRAKGYAVH